VADQQGGGDASADSTESAAAEPTAEAAPEATA
jgi:hypothetical protein